MSVVPIFLPVEGRPSVRLFQRRQRENETLQLAVDDYVDEFVKVSKDLAALAQKMSRDAKRMKADNERA